MIIGCIIIPLLLLSPVFFIARNQLDDGMPVMNDEEWREFHRNIMCCTSPKEARAYERQYKRQLIEKRRSQK